MSDKSKRLHGLDKAGAGDAGAIGADEVLGPCPSCGADLFVGYAEHPHTKRLMRVLTHPVPFCTYYGETDPAEIERTIARTQEES
jgi:hypothetical protein